MTQTRAEGDRAFEYRTRDGAARYRFALHSRDDGWHCTIVSHPSFGARRNDMTSTRRRRSHTGATEIAVRRPLADRDAAIDVACRWSEATQHYLRSGRFAEPEDRRRVAPATADNFEYATLDATAVYRFRFESVRGALRARILVQPPYAGRSDDAAQTFREFAVGGGLPFVAWGGEASTRDELEVLVARWAEATQRYIATGVFPQPERAPGVLIGVGAVRREHDARIALVTDRLGDTSLPHAMSNWRDRLLRRIG